MKPSLVLMPLRAISFAPAQEAVAVIPEEHATSSERVNSGDVPAEAFIDKVVEPSRILGHDTVCLVKTKLDRIISAIVWGVERCLVGAELGHATGGLWGVCKPLPERNDVAMPGNCDALAGLARRCDTCEH